MNEGDDYTSGNSTYGYVTVLDAVAQKAGHYPLLCSPLIILPEQASIRLSLLKAVSFSATLFLKDALI